jgi:hypothetical protein
MQAFKELNMDGDEYLTKEELEAHRDWLTQVRLGFAREQAIGKEDIAELLDERVDLDGDGKISFDEFLHVRAGDLEFTAGEAVQVRASDGRYTTAEIVLREYDCYIVRTFAIRAWQPSWLLAKLLVDGMMLPAIVPTLQRAQDTQDSVVRTKRCRVWWCIISLEVAPVIPPDSLSPRYFSPSPDHVAYSKPYRTSKSVRMSCSTRTWSSSSRAPRS